MNTFFISDNHFGHANIIKHASRPFASVEEMDETMIERWNSVVKNGDEVWHIGDFSFRGRKASLTELFSRLNGKKRLVVGNHDNSDVKKLKWASVDTEIRGEICGKYMHLYHYPMVSWDRQFHGSVQVYGHVHEKPVAIPLRNAFCACVERNNYRPVSFEDMMKRIEKDNEEIDKA